MPDSSVVGGFSPEKTVIYNSKAKGVFLVILLLLWLWVGIFLYIHNFKIPGFILTLLTIIGVIASRSLFDRKPQVIISDRGIFIVKDGFYPWEKIKNEKVIRVGEGRQSKYVLYYHHALGTVKLDISLFNIKPQALQQLLERYRHQYAIRTSA
ncbi:hypothetical protein ACFQZI_02755 [Mucilaginibacter lutimaris]|uniref:PH domain-containing protein n=1 Tax=Mucilaginibacter lutimaris TaxID=931629 RepID=A0ABW2ZC23_9SPHI